MDRSLQTFPARLDALPQVLACVDALMEGGGVVDPETRMRVRIAVEELFVNSVCHGRHEGEEVQIGLGLVFEKHALSVHFEDSAPPFNPFAGLDQVHEALALSLEQRRTGGLGCLLVRDLANSSGYEYRDGRNRIVLNFGFQRVD